MNIVLVWIVMAGLVLVAGIAYRRRIRREVGEAARSLSDDQIRQIEAIGTLERDEDLLDLEEIERAEEEFWRETWEEPESW